ncbi:hypothetical protein T492DRAFT_1088009 [Pavlovales sp. CCMP2436]|nr:hypothetical protein T492DRAFT_1088009 [Pavlovales sp. CCMP2436]
MSDPMLPLAPRATPLAPAILPSTAAISIAPVAKEAARFLSYTNAARALGAVATAGAVAGSAFVWTFARNKPFRADLRETHPQIAVRVDALLAENFSRTSVVMRVIDEYDGEAGDARSSAGAARSAAAAAARRERMPTMPGGVLTNIENFKPASGLPPVVDDDELGPEERTFWVPRRPDGELADAQAQPTPAPHRPSDEGWASVPGGYLAAQLAWLRGKEVVALEQFHAASGAVREHKQRLGSGYLGGGKLLSVLERRVRALRTELRDLAAAKQSAKMYGVFK